MMLCGYSAVCCSDSSFLLYNGLFIITYINATNNYGYGGGAGYCIYNCKEDTYAHFGNIINGKDDHMAEIVNNPCTIKMTNFINCSECRRGVFYQNSPFLLNLIWLLKEYTISKYSIRKYSSSCSFLPLKSFLSLLYPSLLYELRPLELSQP